MPHVLRRVAQDARVRGAGVRDAPHGIEDEDEVGGVLGEGAEARLAGPQRLVRPFAVADVGHHRQRPGIAAVPIDDRGG